MIHSIDILEPLCLYNNWVTNNDAKKRCWERKIQRPTEEQGAKDILHTKSINSIRSLPVYKPIYRCFQSQKNVENRGIEPRTSSMQYCMLKKRYTTKPIPLFCEEPINC